MRNIPKPKKIKTPKVAAILGAAIISLVYALNSLPGGFFCTLIFISILMIAYANLKIFFKNIKRNILEAGIALISIFAGAYVFFYASPSEMYRSEIVIVAKTNNSTNQKIAFRENGLISISPKTLGSIFTNTEGFYYFKDDTMIINKKPVVLRDLMTDTAIISNDKIFPIYQSSNKAENASNQYLQIIEDNR